MKTVIVAGCARSGMTLTMNLLYHGGYPCLHQPPAFEDYMLGNIDWQMGIGKAIKVVDTQLQWPPTGEYVVLLTKRDFYQQAKSTMKFLNILQGLKTPKNPPQKLVKSINRDWNKVHAWASRQSKMLILPFEESLKYPLLTLERISELIDFNLDTKAASKVIERDPECYNGLLESELIQRKI